MQGSDEPVERFLEEAVARGRLSEEQAADCRRLRAALAEVAVELRDDEIAVRKGYLSRDAATELLRALAERRVGRYEVLERLGRGATGVVWRARDTRLDRVVALKLLARPTRPDDVLSSYQERFEREARVAVALNHVNIVRGLDFGEADGYVFFAMEFVAGETLAARVRREGRLPEKEVLGVALQVVSALEHVQRFGLVHRDLKPENLLLTPDGTLKVCDLGLAKPTAAESAGLARGGAIAGTPLYMAPEQVTAPEAVDWRTDAYGLGATLYHLLTGRPPFVPGRGESVIQMHLTSAPADPRELAVDLSQGTSAIVLKLLAKDPQERYATPADLAADLAAAAEGRPPTIALTLRSGAEGPVAELLAKSQGARSRLDASATRRTKLLAAGAVAAAATVVAWSLGADEPSPPPRAGPEAAARPPRAPPAPASSSPPRPAPDPGSAALARAQRLAEEGASLADQIAQFEVVAERWGEHASGRVARSRLAALRELRSAQADNELERRRAIARADVEAGHHGRAQRLLAEFPVAYAGTAAQRAALEEADAIGRSGRGLLEQGLSRARIAAVEWRFDEARSELDRVAALDLAGWDAQLAEAELQLRLAVHEREEERSARLPEFRSAAGRALLEAGTDPGAARARLDAASDDVRLRTYSAELRVAGEWCDRVRRAAVAAAAAWEAWGREGRSVRSVRPDAPDLTVAGVPGSVRDGDFTLRGAEGWSHLGLPALPPDLVAALARAAAAASDERDEDGFVGALLLLARHLDAAALHRVPPLLVDAARDAARRDVDDALAAGRSALVVGDAAGAQRAATDAFAALPADARGWTLLGNARALRRDAEGAERAFRAALDGASPDPHARLGLAQLFEREQRWADAESHLVLFLESTAEAQDAATSALRAQAEAARARIAARRVDAAIEELRRAARSATRAKRRDDAQELYTRILEQRPDDVDALLERGRVYADGGRTFDAYRDFVRVVALRPDDRHGVEAQRELADLGGSRAVPPAAREALSAARAARAAGEFDAAVAECRRAIDLAPFLVDAHVLFAETLLEGIESDYRTVDAAGALSHAEDALLLAQSHAPARIVRARALLRLARADEALADAQRAAADLDDPSPARLVAGQALLALGRPGDALTEFEAAWERSRVADALYWRALAHERLGQPQRAAGLLDQMYDGPGAPAHLRAECDALFHRLHD